MSELTKQDMSLRLAQGALFIVDNAGPVPTNMAPREFQDMVIENHLRNHTYYSGNNRDRVDSQKMRKRIGNLADARLTGTIFEPELGETKIDAVFRLGSTSMPSERLAYYNYDKSTFSEASLPAYIPHSEGNTESRSHQTLPADSALEPLNISSGSKAGKRRHSESAVPGSTGGETFSNMSNQTNTAKRQAVGRSEPDYSQDGEYALGALVVQSAGDSNTSETFLQSSDASTSDGRIITQHHTVPSHVFEATEPESLDTVPGSVLEVQQGPLQWSHIDINAVQRQLNILQDNVREAARALTTCIGRVGGLHCPLDPYPPEDLESIFVRCWGSKWSVVADEAIDFNDFKPELVIMSLISAFLHDNVLSQQVPAQAIAQNITKLLQESGPLGEEYLNHMDLPRTTSVVVKTSYDNAVKRARTTLIKDEAAVQLPLQAEAKQLTEKLWNIILPQLRRLGMLAQLFSRPSDPSEKGWVDVFAPAVTPIIQMALNHKLQLLATGYDYAYIWPSNGENYDERDMKILGAKERLPLAVRFSVFPGLKVSLPGANHASLEMVSEAAVRVQRPERPRS